MGEGDASAGDVDVAGAGAGDDRLCVLGNLAPGTPLGADRLTTSFRDLGCNSLSIMQIISNVNARFKTTLTMQQALSDVGGSVAAVASLVSAQIEAERALDSIAPEAEVRREVVAAIVENLPSGASVSEGDHGKTLLQLGATSMAIMQTLSQVNTRFGTELTLRQVMAFQVRTPSTPSFTSSWNGSGRRSPRQTPGPADGHRRRRSDQNDGTPPPLRRRRRRRL